MAQPALIKGVVSDTKGRPISNARVFFKDSPGPLPDIAALTVAGEFCLAAPIGGEYTIEVAANGFENQITRVAVVAGQTKELVLQLKAEPNR
jgi:hypothetical protein